MYFVLNNVCIKQKTQLEKLKHHCSISYMTAAEQKPRDEAEQQASHTVLMFENGDMTPPICSFIP